ncbi:LuxR C-terminal-related transcriptional regulator [Nguyenibacter vanlangensis]|uniref:LuxR C-terminal-related transcriptional regulator n=1 Tax=Nguyenibacter vanlangensis TaxID=1216886 RepID=A0ABZ3D5D8_9PROT
MSQASTDRPSNGQTERRTGGGTDERTTSGLPRILVADTPSPSLRVLADALEHAGMTAMTEPNGNAMLDRLKALSPDLVVMEVALPGLGGFEVASRIRHDPTFSHIPLIFRTEQMDTQDILRGLAVGGVDYISKSRPVEEMVARIKTHLRMAIEARTLRLALDACHRPTIGVTEDGCLSWYTPAAASLLSGIFLSWQPNTPLPAALREVCTELAKRGAFAGHGTVELNGTMGSTIEDGSLECLTTGAKADGTIGVTLLLRRPGEEERRLAARHSLTTREAQVLFWISRGKSNRDISEVLGISYRTVNKHLEQIFAKLGVENRASAAAIAVKTSTE